MKTFWIFLFTIIMSLNAASQNIVRNTVYGEAVGATGFYSLNYERLLRPNNNVNFAARIGAAYIRTDETFPSVYIFPASLSILKSIHKQHYLEVRLALSTALYHEDILKLERMGGAYYSWEKKLSVLPYASYGIGYRYHPWQKGLFCNVMYQNIPAVDRFDLRRKFSLGIGYSF